MCKGKEHTFRSDDLVVCPETFEKGVALLTSCFLTRVNTDGPLSANLAAWEKAAKEFKFARQPLKDYSTLLESVKLGRQSFTAAGEESDERRKCESTGQ